MSAGQQPAGTVYTQVNETHALPSMYLESNSIQNEAGVKYIVICDKTGVSAGPQEPLRGTPNPVQRLNVPEK